MAMLPRAPNCTTRRAGPGLPQAASTPHAIFTRRRCYKTAWSLLQGELTAMAMLPRAPNCTTRRAGPGLPQAASTPHAILTRRRCYKTAWSLLQGDLTAVAMLPRAPNCTTRRAGPGLPQAASTPHAIRTRRRCYKTAWSLLQGDMTTRLASASAELYDPASGTWTATGSLNTARYSHTATLLQNGMVLVAGGLDSNGIASRAPNCTTRRAGPGLPQAASTPHALYHTATLLQNGTVLVAGGIGTNSNHVLASAELGHGHR